MAQTGYTPIILFYSTTTSNQPTTSNLAVGELALNVPDGKLYFNQSGTIKVLAESTYATSVSTLSFGTTGLTPSSATNGVITVAGTLNVANGGTGATTLTGLAYGNGTSAFTVATAAQIVASISTTAVANATTANSLNTGNSYTGTAFSDSLGNLRNIPINSKTTGYTLLATDNGQCISITTGGITVPNSVFSAGQTVAVFNNSASNQTITQGSGVTMYLGGTATTGNRTLAGYGLATLLFITSSVAVITGAGVS